MNCKKRRPGIRFQNIREIRFDELQDQRFGFFDGMALSQSQYAQGIVDGNVRGHVLYANFPQRLNVVLVYGVPQRRARTRNGKYKY